MESNFLDIKLSMCIAPEVEPGVTSSTFEIDYLKHWQAVEYVVICPQTPSSLISRSGQFFRKWKFDEKSKSKRKLRNC